MQNKLTLFVKLFRSLQTKLVYEKTQDIAYLAFWGTELQLTVTLERQIWYFLIILF